MLVFEKILSAIKYLIKSFVVLFAACVDRYRSNQLLILAYHRILPSDDARYINEQPSMCVTPETFEKNILWLKERYIITSLAEWVEGSYFRGDSNGDRYCAITFDDGWLDNLEFALPIIKKHKIPATVFCVADMVGKNNFWPGRLQQLLLHCTNKGVKDYQRSTSMQWLVDACSKRARFFDWEMLTVEEIDCLIEEAKQYKDCEINSYINIAKETLCLNYVEERCLMNSAEIKCMQKSGLVDIGSHTMNHTRLTDSTCSPVLQQEIVQSKIKLQEITGTKIDIFCYPNGYAPSQAIELVSKTYRAGCALYGSWNSRKSDMARLARVGIQESIAKNKVDFFSRLSGWIR
ncbi:polysaccharide deacetylase family protein [Porticoccus sp. GXU_MW_L64]